MASSPFGRLALTHALGVSGDTLVTMALAGSLFFSIDPSQAKTKVALYLALTMAPFAVVAPVLGPILDHSRAGRRTMVLGTALGRAAICFSMARHLSSAIWLYPEAFGLLVLTKAYAITKSALVPSVVDAEGELVEANSRLAVIAVVAGFVIAIPGAAVLKLSFLGAPWVLRLAGVLYLATALAAVRIPRAPGAGDRTAKANAADAADRAARDAIKGSGIVMAGAAVAALRAGVGFFTFLVAFGFKRAVHHPSWWFGVAIAASLVGTFAGALVAPRVRKRVPEERVLLFSLISVAVVALICARWVGTRPSHPVIAAVMLLGGVIGLAVSAGKLAFDSIVQRDAPDAARGRTFARFETRFQVAWVAGSFLPVVIPVPIWGGMVAIALGIAFAAFSYLGGRQLVRRRTVAAPASTS
ncbi:MAG: Major Facilitator Superfamily transporter [Acidimicrobiales bacterium]|jgi:hypothetical protein|nr:Major Facilitator Superfamily transporter [Acidimicrobiales bacterium]